MYRILVCDDEEEIVSSLTACLTAEGYQTVTARTGWEVLDSCPSSLSIWPC